MKMKAISFMHPPKKYYKKKYDNNGNSFKELDILALIALGISIYIANLGKQNLEYNKKSSETNKQIADELHRLNNSCLLKDIRTQLLKEDNNNE